jgi:hypothetical protein
MQTPDAARRSRLTENKRRHRARQKEYVADLERCLADARAQGIKATKEVQLAAREVAAENTRLRELLRLAGFADEDIAVWAKPDRDGDQMHTEACARRGEIEHKARLCAALTAGPKGLPAEEKTCPLRNNNNRRSEIRAAGNAPQNAEMASSSKEPLAEPASSQSPDSNATMAASPAPSPSEAPSQPAAAQARPCKLLSLLAENPNADITQVPVRPSQDADAAHREGDVECGKAYQMLMQYATSEEKMDYVSRALEAGCTSTGRGGCAVKKEVIWEALDSMCG